MTGERQTSPARGARIVFVNRFYRPDLSATSQMLTQLAEHLASRGMRVAVVTGRGGYESGSVSDSTETLDGVEVRRAGGRVVVRGNLVRRALQAPSIWWALWWELLRTLRPGDVVVALTDPPLIGVVAWLAARIRRARIVHWMQDLFPEVAMVALGSGARRLAGATLPVRDAVLRRSDGLVAIGDRMCDYVSVRAPRTPIFMIANWADDTTLRPLFTPMIGRRERGLMPEATLVVGYQGNLGRAHDGTAILEAARELAERSDIRFVLTGGGVGMVTLRAAVTSLGLANVSFLPYVEAARLNESLCLPDVHLISLRADMEGFVVPSKLYSALSAGRGVIFLGSPAGEVGRALRAAGAGETVDSGRSLAAVVRALSEDPSRVMQWGERARRSIDTAASRARSFDRWYDTLTAIASS